jgi:dihydrofolate reductase
MRRLVVCNIVSLDGFYTGADDNVMALPMDGAFDTYNAERLRAADTLLLGRVSYELFRGYWPPVADDATATATQREISRLNAAIDKVVVSDTLRLERAEPWANTLVLRVAEAHEGIADLKRGAGGDILVFGSRRLWNDLLAHGLVDELHLMFGPVVLGAGAPLFTAVPGVTLRPIHVRTWEDSANVVVAYAVATTSAALG